MKADSRGNRGGTGGVRQDQVRIRTLRHCATARVDDDDDDDDCLSPRARRCCFDASTNGTKN